MSYGSIEAIAEGIGAQATTTVNQQISTAVFSVGLVGSFLPLQQAWMKTLAADADTYYIDSLEAQNDPAKGALAAQVNEKQSMDTTQSDSETGSLNTLLEEAKEQVQYDGNSMSQIFPLQEPIVELMKSITMLIQRTT